MGSLCRYFRVHEYSIYHICGCVKAEKSALDSEYRKQYQLETRIPLIVRRVYMYSVTHCTRKSPAPTPTSSLYGFSLDFYTRLGWIHVIKHHLFKCFEVVCFAERMHCCSLQIRSTIYLFPGWFANSLMFEILKQHISKIDGCLLTATFVPLREMRLRGRDTNSPPVLCLEIRTACVCLWKRGTQRCRLVEDNSCAIY